MTIQKTVRPVTLPTTNELYEGPAGGETIAVPHETPRHRDHWYQWFSDNNLGRAVAVTAAAGIIAASTLPVLAGGCTNNVPLSTATPTATATVDVNSVYRSQVRASLLQDVPDLANYKSALDYTTQRMVDMKNVYGLSLDRVRAPITKWVQANIDWDTKDERLVPLSEGVDLIPDAMLQGNFTINGDVNNKIIAASLKGESVPLTALQAYTDELIAEHNQIWTDIHDPKKLETYLEATFGGMQWNADIATKYINAIKIYGTFEDKASWGLLGRVNWLIGKGLTPRPSNSNEELIRNEFYLSSLLASGGDGRISNNILYFERDGKGITRGDRQTMFRMSQKLKQAITSRPEELGTLLDPNYLAPNLPSLESVEAAKTYSWPADIKKVSMPIVFVYGHWNGAWGSEKRFIYGTPEVARKLGY